MDIKELHENTRKVISLRDEIIVLEKHRKEPTGYRLNEYVELFRDRLIWVDHGERDRFWVPMHNTLIKLDEMANIDPEKFNSNFATYKKNLLSVINRYIKEMHQGFDAHYKEFGSTSNF
jgi:hypothetical protein